VLFAISGKEKPFQSPRRETAELSTDKIIYVSS
jgi:hypothetical protein